MRGPAGQLRWWNAALSVLGVTLSTFFEIAYAAAQKRICFFTGTGFSKAVTANAAPSWQELLIGAAQKLREPDPICKILFPADGPNPLALDEAAQVLAIAMRGQGIDIHVEIADKIRCLKLVDNSGAIPKFMSAESFNVVTTNYDKLLEELVGPVDCHSLSPGMPIPRSESRVSVYHVHGSIDSPENMVVTSDDYFGFLNRESYFSRKLSTILHENTLVVLGYSLGDTNLKAIINDHRGFSRSHVVGSSLFFVARSGVPQPIKDYYSHCYGIRVVDSMEIEDFFARLNAQLPEAKRRVLKSVENIHKVLEHGSRFKPDFLRLEDSFYEIISSFSAIGQSIEGPRQVKVLGDIIETKVALTREDGAWDQYEHLARWLIYLASILELEHTSIRDKFLEATTHSMRTMRKDLELGYSWHAYKAWDKGWAGIIASNRKLIRAHVELHPPNTDTLEIVKRSET